jgi:hypothetical protein
MFAVRVMALFRDRFGALSLGRLDFSADPRAIVDKTSRSAKKHERLKPERRLALFLP